MNSIDIIYFDMGNTLVNFKNNKKTTFDSSMEEIIGYINRQYNIKIAYEILKKYYETWQKKVQLYESKNQEVDITITLNEFFQQYGITFSEEEAMELYKVFYRQTFNNAQLEPYAAETLYEIKKKYKTGIISNMPIYSEVTKEIFKILKIDTLIDYYLFSYDIKICKPNLEIFRKAILDNKIPAINSVMIGDSIKNDYLPAQQIGMYPILYGNNKEYNCFDDYRKMIEKVKKYEKN